jgi:class 3 adenylate cyclase/predicted ATPase
VDIAAWLRGLGLEQYERAFRDNAVDAEVLPELTSEDLKDLGVVQVGHRRKLLSAIAALHARPAGAPAADAAAAAPVVPGSAAPPRAAPEPSHAERRQLTVLFCDLVDSTALSARLDPEDLREVIRAYQDACAGAIARFDGIVAKFMGDGVLAYFGFPRAHEDEAERAVQAGLAIVAAVSRLQTHHVALAVRVGIDTGLVVVGDLVGEGVAQELAVLGETPNLAARLQSLSEPNSVVIGPRTRRLVGGLFDLADLGTHQIKGFAQPVQAWRVLGASTAESHFEAFHADGVTPLVGREEEIELLLRRWEQAKEGEGQVVLLSGEPGIGKSRLVRTLRERLRGEAKTRLSYYCSPYHVNTALHPFIEQLKRAAGLAPDDPPERQLAKIEALLGRAVPNVQEAAPLIADLLSIPDAGRSQPLNLSPQRRKELTLDALLGQLEGLAAEQPVLVVFEDAHWIDPSSKELLETIFESLQSWRVLLTITFRPDFIPPWTGAAQVTALLLDRLSRRQVASLVERITGSKPLPAPVLDQIVARTDGVPLFVEELTKAVLESGLVRDRGDRYVLTGPLPPLAIPATLHDSLTARLDRLAPVKEVAQIGATIGREFSYELLAAVSSLKHNELNEALGQLIGAELIFRRGTPAHATYTFKHALVQEAAYDSLLRNKRQELHACVAQALQQQFPETCESHPEVLAHHFTEAGLTEDAITYWQRAGQRAAERSAFVEATAHLTKALELTSRLPDARERAERELALQIAFAPVLMLTKGFGSAEVQRTYQRARDLCREVGDPSKLFAVTWGLWHASQTRGDLEAAQGFADELLAVARQQGNSDFLLQAHHAAWTTRFHLGDQMACREHTEQGRALYHIEAHASHRFVYGGHDPGVCARYHGALATWLLGYPDQALSLSREAIDLAERLRHPMSQIMAHAFASVLHQFRREPQPAQKSAEATIAACIQQEIAPQYLATGRILRGWAVAALGRAEEGAAEAREGLADLQATGMNARRPHYLTLLAEAEVWAGRAEHGLAALAEAGELTERTGERRWEAEIHRLRGELILASNASAEAEACFRRALGLAVDQHAKALELRAAASLARVLQKQGKSLEAHELLVPVYRWFSEGFDTPDLIEARALLDVVARSE